MIYWIPCSLDAIVSYFSAKFWTLLCPQSEDNRVRYGATGRSVPLKCLKRTGCLTASLLIYPCCLFNWSVLYSTILCSRADLMPSCHTCIVAWLVPCKTAAILEHILCKPYNHAQWNFTHSYIHRVHVCLAITGHLHFWQNNQDLLRATGVERIPKQQSAQKADLGEEHLSPRTHNLSITSQAQLPLSCPRSTNNEENEMMLSVWFTCRRMQITWLTARSFPFLHCSFAD